MLYVMNYLHLDTKMLKRIRCIIYTTLLGTSPYNSLFDEILRTGRVYV